jgi:DNA polymerase III epsilon subunit-like protein
MDTVHVIDFEGTKKLGISEFGVVTLRNFEIVNATGRRCAGKFSEYLNYFLFLRRTGLFAAHSAQTEDGLLRHHWASPGKVPLFTDDSTTLSWGPWIDTKLIHRKLFSDLPSNELRDLIATFGLRGALLALAKEFCTEKTSKFHCSLFDALATALLIKNLTARFSNVSPKILLSICRSEG